MRKTKPPTKSQLERLANLQAGLEQERTELQRRIGQTESWIRDGGVFGASLSDNFSSDLEELVERASHYHQRLRVLNRTLHRLREGSFGICAECEQPISQKRLDAMPTAEYCIRCQQEFEQAPREYAITQ
jgi:DnaK suppressor protein